MSDTSAARPPIDLPAEFADLTPLSEWVLPTERERYGKRIATSMDGLQAFYNALFPRMEDAVAYLAQVPYDDMPDDAANLLWMCCSLVTVSFAVEAWRQPRVPDSGAASFNAVLEPAI